MSKGLAVHAQMSVSQNSGPQKRTKKRLVSIWLEKPYTLKKHNRSKLGQPKPSEVDAGIPSRSNLKRVLNRKAHHHLGVSFQVGPFLFGFPQKPPKHKVHQQKTRRGIFGGIRFAGMGTDSP